MNSRRFITVVVVLASVPATILAQEKSIQRSDLPSALRKAIDQQSKGAIVRGFSKETERGQVTYEAELTIKGHSKDVSMDAKGNVIEVEEQVSFDSLPDAVKRGLQAKADKGKIRNVESLTTHGQLVAYEARVVIGAKRFAIQVGPTGKPLAHKE